MNIHKTQEEIFSVDHAQFNTMALDIFHYQYHHVDVYHRYVDLLKNDISTITHYDQIPFLPISIFKNQMVSDQTHQSSPVVIFESSTTTGQIPSKHYVNDINLYRHSFLQGFQSFFGEIKEYCILGLLPSYLERGQSSLVYMVNDLMQQCGHTQAGFYLYEHENLFQLLKHLEAQKQPTLLFGVTYALLDFAEKYNLPLRYTRIIETGGMKGRREELTKTEVHQILKEKFSLEHVYSEYGMTELLSQAYSLKDEIFKTPNWMKVLIRDIYDPMKIMEVGRGALNIIDLANIHSCSFIATDDLGERYPDGSFKVLGRLDQSEWRGCSLLTL